MDGKYSWATAVRREHGGRLEAGPWRAKIVTVDHHGESWRHHQQRHVPQVEGRRSFATSGTRYQALSRGMAHMAQTPVLMTRGTSNKSKGMDGRLRATRSDQGHAVPNQELSDRRACDLERGGRAKAHLA